MKIAILLFLGILPWSGQNNYQTCLEYVSSPKRLARVLRCLKYQKRPPKMDIWKSSVQTFQDKGGNCRDFGVFAFVVLKYHGYGPIMYRVYNDESAHIIVSYAKDKEEGYFSNTVWNPGVFDMGEYLTHSKYHTGYPIDWWKQ